MDKRRGNFTQVITGTLLAATLLMVSVPAAAAAPEAASHRDFDDDTPGRLRRIWETPISLNPGYTRADEGRSSFCSGCELNFGFGGTYHSFEGTGGQVIPMTVTWDRGRWEVGLFHFSEQTSADNSEDIERVVAHPYWAASVSRRIKLFEHGPFMGIFGFGLSYRTERDILSATYWNFSSQFGLRFQSPRLPAVFELSARHWSNGGVETPNRGQDFTVLTIRFDR
jgi:hypothetical protein